ncbi:ABC transporter ATP-binding protein [Pseudonocardia alaniniphila]|uniref:ATP-binding cassette domain-containing protein n=1 Tax=Pseudonocardia alaniniphila TaxID=75291 RepID=A0ABS9TUR3_9PSEU|nr:ATP-binding cassette domain-containing protein [Pseudonocardia alaniniphila]MCH6172300.1 ATP-binding cassette domain-containing protein [Pseudonocardia alaniniphila]
MLEIHDVRLVYNQGRADEITALDGLTLTLADGQFATVIGSNGAGKSSLVQIVSGATRPTAGRVRLDGTDITRQPEYRRAGSVARVFDDPRAGTAPGLSIEDNMALAMARGRRRWLRFALGRTQRALMREQLARLGLGLENRLADKVGLLSAGQRQSLTMVMAALARPRVLLLDEHLAALDPATAIRVRGLTEQLVAEMGTTTLMITHNMQHALELGQRLLVMNRGRLIGDLDADTKRQTTVSALVDLITAFQDNASDRLLITDRTPPERT